MRFASLGGQLAGHDGSPPISINVLRRKLAVRLLAFLTERQVGELFHVPRAAVVRWRQQEAKHKAVSETLQALREETTDDVWDVSDLADETSDATEDDEATQDEASRAEYVREHDEC